VIPALHPDELALSFIYGLLTALAFGLWPLGRVHDVPVAALFRDEVAPEWHRPRWSYLALMAVVIALLIAVAIGLPTTSGWRRCLSPPQPRCSRCCVASPPA